MAYTKEQFREYQRNRSRERLALARERLGGACARCGTTENLEFDHVDPAAKVREVSASVCLSLEKFLLEVDRCQLLCHACHVDKSVENGDLRHTGHGEGAKGRNGCKCEPCKVQRNAYARLMKANRKVRERAER
jgi:hypothetical protein